MCSHRDHALTGDEQASIRAADLAEWIVQEISEADQDWGAIAQRARELLALAMQRAGAPRAGGPPCGR